jgi:membrane associated rhomboid family serine protease
MCICNRQLDPKTRRRMVIANISFIFAILLWNSERWNWVQGFSRIQLNWLHAITGFLFGLYIAILLCSRRCGRRNRAVGSGEL